MIFIKKLFAFRDPAQVGRERLRRESEEWTKKDPLLGAKTGSREVTQRLLFELREGGVHFPSAVCALGALAGYACQDYVRASAKEHGIELKDMQSEVKLPLLGVEFSVWSLVMGAAPRLGSECMPEPAEILAHNAAAEGTDAFGVPRVPAEFAARELPLHYVQSLWPILKPIAERHCSNPAQWPMLFAMSVQQVINIGSDALDPCIAMRLAFESAVPMSRVQADLS